MGLKSLRHEIEDNCISCGKCEEECLFLKDHGLPKDIAADDDFDMSSAFRCSQCRLCEAVCPKDLDIPGMLLEMRREALKRDKSILKKYKRILRYESLGSSKLLSLYHIPKGCDTVIFPGCGFAHTRPDLIKKLYRSMKEKNKSLGIVLDCCFIPSLLLGREEYFSDKLSGIKTKLGRAGIKKIITLCPSCYAVFKKHLPAIDLSFIYDEFPFSGDHLRINGPIHLIDPCTVRFDMDILDNVRSVLSGIGIKIDELPHSREKTFCCGEGGSTLHLTRRYADNWLERRKGELKESAVTYCTGCIKRLEPVNKNYHLLDILLNNKKINRKHNIMGYVKRALLKRQAKRL